MAVIGTKRRILAAIGSRANYGSLKSALREIQAHEDLQLEIVAYSSALLDRFGDVASLIERDGFNIDYKSFSHVEGETPLTMARSSGLSMIDLAQVYDQSRPDYVLLVGDRYEVLPAAISAAYMNIRVAHVMGGELTGTIDESVRHAISKLSHKHFPATEHASKILRVMGEDPEHIHWVGCPRVDLAAEILARGETGHEIDLFEGVGAEIDLSKDFILVLQHPVTTEYALSGTQMDSTLEAVSKTGFPAVVMWPNSDAGGAEMSTSIRVAREKGFYSKFRFVKNLPPEKYMSLMNKTICLVGNSSSAIREGSFMGTPAVSVGTRQSSRELGPNVLEVSNEAGDIFKGISKMIEKPRPDQSYIYGTGKAGASIANILATSSLPPIQKKFNLPSSLS